MEEKLQLTHPAGKKAISMQKVKYKPIMKAILRHLKNNGDSTHTEIWKAIVQDFKKNKIDFEGSIQWHMEWVKLDLEARKEIIKIPETIPQKYRLPLK